jgi:hypothetical protein
MYPDILLTIRILYFYILMNLKSIKKFDNYYYSGIQISIYRYIICLIELIPYY